MRIGVLAGGTSVELAGGVIGIVLVVAGLAGQAPAITAALAAIVLGGALFAHGCAILARWDEVVGHLDRNRYEIAAVINGVGTETFGGATSAIVGALVLANVSPPGVLGAAIIALSSAVLLGGAAQPQLVEITIYPETPVQHVAHRAIEASGGILVLAGIVALACGAVAVLGIGPAVLLSLVAELAIAIAMLLAGGALTARFASYRAAHS
ncbi:MAG: hypothetical protein JWO36_4978 [Myxococcales bacterium]|nr:hypothetical protein [Myxococcales bacterium]